eukprot:1178465-Prorocentrum_minimum.AAC.1
MHSRSVQSRTTQKRAPRAPWGGRSAVKHPLRASCMQAHTEELVRWDLVCSSTPNKTRRA